VVVREGLRTLVAEHNGASRQPFALDALRTAADGLHNATTVDSDGDARAVAATPDLPGALGLILALVGEAQAAGTWARLKACPGEHCGWAFYDHSRNQASTWCSMAVCGSREKARAYRRRSSSR